MNQELQIIDLVEGEGKAAVKGALITTQYTGWLADGTEFDSSWSRGKPFQCVIGTGRVIKGWTRASWACALAASASCWCRRTWVMARVALVLSHLIRTLRSKSSCSKC